MSVRVMKRLELKLMVIKIRITKRLWLKLFLLELGLFVLELIL